MNILQFAPPPILLILLSCIPFSTQMRRCLSLNHSLIGCFLCLAFFLAKVLRPPSFVLSPHHNAQHRFCRCIIGSVFPYHDWLPDIVHRVGERYRTRPFFFLVRRMYVRFFLPIVWFTSVCRSFSHSFPSRSLSSPRFRFSNFTCVFVFASFFVYCFVVLLVIGVVWWCHRYRCCHRLYIFHT